MKFLASFQKRLWIKVMVALVPMLMLCIGLIIGINIYNQNRLIRSQTQQACESLAATIESSSFDALAVGNNNEVRKQFSRLKEQAAGIDVSIFDFNGDITFASDAAMVHQGIRSLLSNNQASAAVDQMLKDGSAPAGSFEEIIQQKSYLSLIRPILNAENCHHCHGSSRKILGASSSGPPTLASKGCGRLRGKSFVGAGQVIGHSRSWNLAKENGKSGR